LLQCFSEAGSLIEFAGEKGSGKTSLLHIICSKNTLQNKKTLYIDGSGDFRPEKIHDYLEKSASHADKERIIEYLRNISYVRIYEPESIFSILRKIRLLDVDCVVIDDLIILCLHALRSKMRFEVRMFVRDMALLALVKKINIIFTNTIISRIETIDSEPISYELFYNDLIRYVHVRGMLHKLTGNVIDCNFVYPQKLDTIKLQIAFTRSFTQ